MERQTVPSVRFTDASPPRRPAPSEACGACGFRCEREIMVHTEPDGPEVARCDFCHAATHLRPGATRRDRAVAGYALVWMPDLDQRTLLAIVRAAVVARVVAVRHEPPSDLDRGLGAAIRALSEGLRRRERPLLEFVRANGGGATSDLPTVLDADLPTDAATIMEGVRYLPTDVPASRVDDWLESEGTLQGFDLQALEGAGWWLDRLGMSLDPWTGSAVR